MSKKRATCAAKFIVPMIAAGAVLIGTSVKAEETYAGQRITLIVANPAGSGYDAYARLLARHIVNHIPGKPSMIVQNMPGAGGIKATDYTATVAPKDGSAFALVVPGALVEPLVADPGKYRYDPAKFGYVGTMDSGTRLCLTSPKSAIKSVADARKKKVNVGATGTGSSSYQYPMFTNAFAGTQFNTIMGYQGPPDIFIALERGEVDGACGFDVSTFAALRPAWLKGENKAHPILQYGMEASSEATEMGFPSIWEFVKSEDKEVVELIVAQQVFQRPFVTPPSVPKQRLEILQNAFSAAMKDPALIADAEKSKLNLNPKSGPEVAALVQKMYGSPKPLIARMKRAILP